MAWIKRNLLFVIGSVVALLAVGGAGFYTFLAYSHNADAFAQFSESVDKLKGLMDQKPAPGSGAVDNIKIAKEQNQQLLKWLATAQGYFQPIAPIPAGTVTSEAYAGALHRTIDQLQKEAEAAGVVLPPKYDFAFSAQRPLVKFAGNLDLLAAQLGEVKTMAEILFAARVNALDAIQRVRVTDDDNTGPQTDYIEAHPATNELAIITPYTLSFRCFTPELSAVLNGFSKASSTFIIKSINVQSVAANGMPGMPEGNVGPNPGMPGAPMLPPGYRMNPGGYPTPGVLPAATTPKNASQAVLKEQLLRVTLEVGLVKLIPKN
ncbi:MAG TPA: Amuc_1100 family pilus-like protein [Verrucomicrobiae bacterium]